MIIEWETFVITFPKYFTDSDYMIIIEWETFVMTFPKYFTNCLLLVMSLRYSIIIMIIII